MCITTRTNPGKQWRPHPLQPIPKFIQLSPELQGLPVTKSHITLCVPAGHVIGFVAVLCRYSSGVEGRLGKCNLTL